jgi:thiamine transport system substrate-binding protein
VDLREYMEPWKEWRPKGFEHLVDLVPLDFVPFDYGIFALMADDQALQSHKLPKPHSLADLLSPALKRSLLLEDPRTSTPGMAFLLFTEHKLGKKFDQFWKGLRGQWLTLSPGWDQAYGLFLKGEAPLVWSYVTSEAYHIEHGEPARYHAALFDEGNPVQVEGAAIIKGALTTDRERKLAHDFLEFLLTKEVQEKIPLTNWMYPIVEGTKLPHSFEKLPKQEHIFTSFSPAEDRAKLLKAWSAVIRDGKP